MSENAKSKPKEKGRGAQQQQQQVDRAEERLQALVLTDSFERRFSPVTYEKPKALLPLCSVPMLDYVMECLLRSGVKDVFLFVCNHVQHFKEYIAGRKWGTMHVQLIVKQAVSIGAALREVDHMGVITGDFILIRGDTVSNVNLSKIVEEHKARRANKQNAIMTCVMREVPPHHRCRSSDDDIVVVMESGTSKLLRLHQIKKERQTITNPELFDAHSSVQVRYDLADCHIAICTSEVLVAFTDNFDWQDVQSDCINGVLTSEILGQNIFVHVLSSGYACRVKDFCAYDAISKDILLRWTHPFVLDFNLFLENSSYVYARPGFYKEKNVHLAQSCRVGEDCAIGNGTQIGDKSEITRSVIGRRCLIGERCAVSSSYLWENVTIGNGARVEGAVLCDGVVIGENAVIEKGAVISFKVVIGAGHTVKAYTRVTCTLRSEEDDDGEDWGSEDEIATPETNSAFQSNPDVVGPHGHGCAWIPAEDEDARVENSIVYTPNWDNEDSDSDSDSDAGSCPESEEGGEQHADHFLKLVSETVKNGVQAGHSVDNIVLEVNRLRIHHDSTMGECGAAALTGLIASVPINADPKLRPKDLVAILKKWKDLIFKYLCAHKGTFNQKLAMVELAKYCHGIAEYKSLYHFILKTLYDLDLVLEESILEWHEEAGEADEIQQFFAKQCTKLVEWLQESEEEDSD